MNKQTSVSNNKKNSVKYNKDSAQGRMGYRVHKVCNESIWLIFIHPGRKIFYNFIKSKLNKLLRNLNT